MWSKLQACIKGGVIGDIYFIVLVLVNLSCPADTECFSNYFMIPIFTPLILIEPFLSKTQINYINNNNILVNLAIWFIIGSILGIIYSLFTKRNERKLKVKTVE
jgi:hypothetical protein